MSIYHKFGLSLVIKRELKRISSRPLYCLLGIVFPLLSFVFFWMLFDQGIPQNLPVTVLDNDQSQMSRKITRMIEASPTMHVAHRVNDLGSGKSSLQAGRSYALIVFPAGLENDAVSGRAPKVVNYYNNQYLLAGSLINRDLRKVIGTVSGGLNLHVLQKQAEMNAAAMARIEPLQMKSRVLFNPYMNYLYFLAGTLNPTILQMFIIMLTIYALGIELKEGSAKRWLKIAGGKYWKAVLGKLAPYFVLFSIIGLFMNSFHFNVLNAPNKGNGFVMVLGILLFVLANQAVALTIVAISSNTRLGLSMGAFYSGTAFAFVGMTFPLMAMPFIAKFWAALLPLTYYIKIFVGSSMRGTPFMTNLPYFAALALFCTVLPTLAMWRMRYLIADSKHWGKI